MIKIINSIYKIFLELFIFDKKLRAKLKARFAKLYLKKYVDFGINCKIDKNKNRKDEKIIWQYWHQGAKEVPKIIKKCLLSVKEQMKGYKQIVLDYNSIKDYVELPDRYYQLLEDKKMKIAHFSNVLRVYLLEKYGGTWIDSTIYLTDKIPDEIMNSNFCILQKDILSDLSGNNNSCFFIHNKEYSAHIAMMKNILDKYWAENDFVINYFMFEHISTMLSQIKGELKDEWDNMPRYSAEITGELQKHLFDEFKIDEFEKIKKLTPIHKLTYKKPKKTAQKNTYYDYILNEENK